MISWSMVVHDAHLKKQDDIKTWNICYHPPWQHFSSEVPLVIHYCYNITRKDEQRGSEWGKKHFRENAYLQNTEGQWVSYNIYDQRHDNVRHLKARSSYYKRLKEMNPGNISCQKYIGIDPSHQYQYSHKNIRKMSQRQARAYQDFALCVIKGAMESICPDDI